jgi:hypothetical protein
MIGDAWMDDVIYRVKHVDGLTDDDMATVLIRSWKRTKMPRSERCKRFQHIKARKNADLLA